MNKLKTEYLKITLSNGINCILYPRNEIHSVTISAKVNVGSLDENKETNGLSHLLEHLAFDATHDFDNWEKLNSYLNEISGSSNAYTSDDHTKYYGTFPYQFFEEGIRYISEVTLNPLYKEEDIKKEVDIIIDEKIRYDDSIEYQVQLGVIENRFSNNNTSYSQDVIGTIENLKRFNRKDVVSHFNKYYSPQNIEIYIVGRFDIAIANVLLEKYFGEFKNDNIDTKRDFILSYPNYSGFKIKAKQKLDINQYYLVLSFPSSEFTLTPFEERYLLSFLSVITASQQHQTSILWKRLREELGIVYDVSSWTFGMMSRAMFAIDTNFNPEYLEAVLKEIYVGINKIKSGKEGLEIFNKRKKRLIDTELMRYDNPSNVIDWISMQEEEQKFHNRSLLISEFIDLVKKYSFDDVVTLANKIYNWDNANLIILSKDNPESVEKNVTSLWNKIISSN